MKYKIIISLLIVLLFSGCVNTTNKICTELKYSSNNSVTLDNNICIINGTSGNNTIKLNYHKGLYYVDVIILNTNNTCDSLKAEGVICKKLK